MAQQTVQMQRLDSVYDREGLQRLQQEIDQEQYNLQRMTSEEERADRRKMRELFDSVRNVNERNTILFKQVQICSMNHSWF